MLQVSAGHTLVPRLRAASTRKIATKLLRHEAVMMFGVSVLAAPLLLWLTPWIIDLVAGSAVDGGYLLTAAVIAVGFVRLWEGLSAAIVNAIGTPRELFIWSVLGWGGIAVAVALAHFAARHGLNAVVL